MNIVLGNDNTNANRVVSLPERTKDGGKTYGFPVNTWPLREISRFNDGVLMQYCVCRSCASIVKLREIPSRKKAGGVVRVQTSPSTWTTWCQWAADAIDNWFSKKIVVIYDARCNCRMLASGNKSL